VDYLIEIADYEKGFLGITIPSEYDDTCKTLYLHELPSLPNFEYFHYDSSGCGVSLGNVSHEMAKGKTVFARFQNIHEEKL